MAALLSVGVSFDGENVEMSLRAIVNAIMFGEPGAEMKFEVVSGGITNKLFKCTVRRRRQTKGRRQTESSDTSKGDA